MAAELEVVALDTSRSWSAVSRGSPRVEVLDGTVLVTVEGDPADRVLTAGDVFAGPPRRRVAATGLSRSRIRVSAPELPALARLAARGAAPLARHLFGGALILAVWLSLWTWVAIVVAAPLATGPRAGGGTAAETAERVR
ncbi:DUF2917 domain-containing protein [Anaeromyxobacter diazotrophicus]|uniref:Uncharacterized protein n=1 Tax=Anaeromyxobacter diazotrophicus TaxID=2590199 RepID=A0A7I9VQM0_9BACT|nr:DUF2917 domain-containing protein [Anaeromyxobacter diazotrophicus]GEJ58712.1 hypothetical protein AMYX_34530 [Anaeromyxobacter diazotrophicus]